MRVEVLDPDYSPEMQGRLGKLEAAISKQRTVKFPYWSISRDDERERTVNPYALFQDGRLVRGRPGPRRRGRAHVPRLADPRRDPLRDAPRARLPPPGRLRRRAVPRPRRLADRRPRRRGADRGRRRHGLVGRSARTATAAGSRTGSSSPSTRACPCSRRGSCARTAARRRRLRTSSGARSPRALRLVRDRHEKQPAGSRPSPTASDEEIVERPAAPVAPGALRRPPGAARLPARRCGESRRRRSRPRTSSSASASRPRSSRSTSRCSTSSTSAAAATRSTPSSTATRCTSTRSSSATRSAPRRA